MAASIGAAGVVIGALVGLLGQARLQRFRDRREAEAVLVRYREPLISAAVDLQYSLYNVLCKQYLWRLVRHDESGRRQLAIDSTLYNFAQYFGWREVLRREAQFLRFEEVDRTREVSQLLSAITSRFSARDPDGDESFRLFKAEQRGIGELMLTRSEGRFSCAGYAEFLAERRGRLAGWLDRLEADLEELSESEHPNHERLRDLQGLLAELAERLDDQGVRFARPFKRADSDCLEDGA